MGFIAKETGIVYEESGKILAEVCFSENENGAVAITRTFVDETLRGQGMAGKLMLQAAEQLRASNKKAVPVCSYAVAWFEKHPEYADVLAEA